MYRPHQRARRDLRELPRRRPTYATSAAVFVAVSLSWATGLFSGSAAVAATKYTPCAPIVIGGKQWLIYTYNLPCSTAGDIIRAASRKPAPPKPTYKFPGTFAGLACYRPGASAGIYCAATHKPKRAVEGLPM